MKSAITVHSLLLVFALMVSSCDEPSTDEPKDDDPKILPGKSVAILPENMETCSDFSEVAGETDKASVVFKWTSAENAAGYLLQVFESETEIASKPVETTETEVILDKGKTYFWMVTAANEDGVTTSDTFSFTAPGEAVGNYVPYAAEINFEYNSSTTELDISWIASDLDGDTLIYDVIVKENATEIVVQNDLEVTNLETIDAIPGTYYWVQVKSKDPHGNFSISTHVEVLPN